MKKPDVEAEAGAKASKTETENKAAGKKKVDDEATDMNNNN